MICGVYFPVKSTFSPKPLYTIVIDAGHGGADGGAVGKTTGVTESYLNLKYAKCLKSLCEQANIAVVMTRENMSGLYSPLASNKKRSEMERRKDIINSSNPDAVISIHMNSYPRSDVRGAQVFYKKENTQGEELANSIQTQFCQNLDYSKPSASVGDYYVLNCNDFSSVLIECGFLSNTEEESLLINNSYMEKMCLCILSGLLNFFKM